MQQFYFQLLILGFVLFCVWYFTNQQEEFKKLKELWQQIKADAEVLSSVMKTRYDHIKSQERLLQAAEEQRDTHALVAAKAIMVGAQLAQQMPSIHSLEYIKQNFYPEFDPVRMKCLFMSASSYDYTPKLYKNSLFVIFYGLREETHHYAGQSFYQVHTNDGELQVVKDYGFEDVVLREHDELLKTIERLVVSSPVSQG